MPRVKTPPTVEELREQLAALGEQRAANESEKKVIAKKVEKLLRMSYGRIDVAEAAKLLNIHRTTVYRVYAPHES